MNYEPVASIQISNEANYETENSKLLLKDVEKSYYLDLLDLKLQNKKLMGTLSSLKKDIQVGHQNLASVNAILHNEQKKLEHKKKELAEILSQAGDDADASNTSRIEDYTKEIEKASAMFKREQIICNLNKCFFD